MLDYIIIFLTYFRIALEKEGGLKRERIKSLFPSIIYIIFKILLGTQIILVCNLQSGIRQVPFAPSYEILIGAFLYALSRNSAATTFFSRFKFFFFFFKKELIGRIINCFSRFGDISKIQNKKDFLMLY